MTGRPSLTVIIPARNESRRWPQVLANLRAQTLQPDQVVVADGASTDGSRAWLDGVAATDPTFEVVDNPARIVPAALNTALGHATGDIVARMDTHADYSPEYLERVVDVLVRRPDVAAVGGAMRTEGEGEWGTSIAAVLRRRIGLGGARHRVAHQAGPVVHVFSGCYRRDALLAVGGWDERLRANEDFEADLRIAGSAGEVWLEPSASTTWYVRRDPRALAVQMWRYGYYKALTLRLHPRSLQPRQLAPPVLVAGLVLGSLLSARRTAAVAGLYLSVMGAAGASAARDDGASMLRGAVVPPIVHLSWGAGLLTGLVRFARGAPAVSEYDPAGSADPVAAITRSWWVVLLAVVIGAAAVAGVVQSRPDRFTSTTVLLYSAGDPGDALLGGGGQGDPIRTLNTQVQLVTSDAVVVPAAQLLGLPAADLRGSLSVELALDSNVLQIHGSAETAQAAQQRVTAVSDSYISYNRELGVDKLVARADGLSTTAASLNTRLAALPPAPAPAAAAAADPRQAAFAAQIVALAQQEDQLRTAAASYPGPLSVLSAADQPVQPSSLGVVGGAGIGAGLGLALGLLLSLLRMPRGRQTSLTDATQVPRARHDDLDRASPFADTRAS